MVRAECPHRRVFTEFPEEIHPAIHVSYPPRMEIGAQLIDIAASREEGPQVCHVAFAVGEVYPLHRLFNSKSGFAVLMSRSRGVTSTRMSPPARAV